MLRCKLRGLNEKKTVWKFIDLSIQQLEKEQ
jgi:hypothetical protein